jgi:nitrogen regulatory protein PII
MKLITAFIKPFKLGHVREALMELGVFGMSVTEIKGFGHQRGHKELYHGAQCLDDSVPKTRLEIAVPEELADAVVDAIATAAKTGKVGDGRILIGDIERVVRIRTGETDTTTV